MHPALELARPEARAVLARVMDAMGAPLELERSAAEELLGAHARLLARGERGDMWIELGQFLSEPRTYLARRGRAVPPDEVIGALHWMPIAETYYQPPNVLAYSSRVWTDSGPIETAGVSVEPTPKPGIVSGSALEAFADAVDAGYRELSLDVQADQGEYFPVDKPGPRKLGSVFVREWSSTFHQWADPCAPTALGLKCGMYAKIKKVRAGEMPTLSLASSDWDEVEKYRALLADFRARFSEETGTKPRGTLPAGPGWAAPAPSVPGGSFLGSGPGTQLKEAAIGLGLLGLLLALVLRR